MYRDKNELLIDLSKAINVEIKRLAEAGAQYIQIDEPLLARYPETAKDIGAKFCTIYCLRNFAINCFYTLIFGTQIA